MKFKSVLFFGLVLILTACNSTSTSPDDGWKKIEYPLIGVNFEIPETWVTIDNENLINIARTEAELKDEVTPEMGASITLATTYDFDGYSDPVDILMLFIDYFESGRPKLERLSEPESITIQELPSATVSYQGTVRDQTGHFTATVINNDKSIALVFTFDGSEEGIYLEELERFTRSIFVFPPTK